MYGGSAYSTLPYGVSGLELDDHEAMLDSDDDLIYTVTLVSRAIGDPTDVHHYFASSEWGTGPFDYPASRSFAGRVASPLTRKSSLIGDRLGVNYLPDGGSRVVLNNDDEELDELVSDHVVDGRRVLIKLGRKSDFYANHLILFDGLASELSTSASDVILSVRDKSFKLEVPATTGYYLGTGDAEGTSNLTGKRKPLAYGIVEGVTLTLIDPTNLIYQWNDGPGLPNGLSSGVRDRGVPLTFLGGLPYTYAELVAAATSPGGYRYSSSLGLLKIGAQPAGVLTIRAEVDNPVTGELEQLPTVILSLIDRLSLLHESEIDYGAFDSALAAAIDVGTCIASVFIGTDSTLTVSAVASKVMESIGGWAWFDRRGTLKVRILEEPTGGPVMSFARDEGDIFSLSREKLPGGVLPPPWRWRVSYGPNETVFTDFAGSVAASTKEFFAQPYRIAFAEDTAIQVDHLLALDPPVVETYFREEADAQTESERLLALYSAGYDLFRMRLSRRALLLELGDLILVTFPRYGLEGGRLLRVVEMQEVLDVVDGSSVDQVEVVGYG